MKKEVVKNTKFEKQNAKVNNLENKISDTSTSDKSIQRRYPKFGEKIGDVDTKKHLTVVV